LALEISAVIPHYNQQYCLEESIQSILQQDVTFNKILIIDDCSQNFNKLKFLKSYNQIEVIQNKVNMGRGFCRNLAINKLNDKFIFFLDSSNFVKKGYVKNALTYFINEEVSAVSGLIHNAPDNKSFTTKWRGRHLFKEQHKFGDKEHYAKSLTTYGTILRRSAVIEVGNFDSSLKHSEDKDLGLRLLKAGYKIIGDPKLVAYSMKKDTIISVLERYWRWYCGTNEKFLLKDYWHAFKASFRPMIQEDIKANDWKSALISFLCPHYGYCRYLFRKLTGKIQKHS
tara:strand:- start:7553 stop:8404 length:852 start_codon:yes stop_codon:yes gene_type:complete